MPFDELKLKNQLCFPLYACSKEIIKKYTPLLDNIGLTYTQYITILVLWEHQELNMKDLGRKLYLDSGTLTPLVKKLENLELITRMRDPKDERNIIISLTKKGDQLKQKAIDIPKQIAGYFSLDEKEAMELYRLIYKILDQV